ncbi:MAG: glycine cleavage system protein GcvH [Nitrospirota bacterium]|nr:glycine cleavage system protein GcvH [Nitrospirota bacterium]
MIPENLKYHREHCWAKISGKKAVIGITDYAQEALGDIVYIDIPELDSEVEIDGEMGEIESTKATSSLVSPVSGTVVEVNEEIADSPEIINEDPYGKGWICAIALSDPSEIATLMDARAYEVFIEEEEG